MTNNPLVPLDFEGSYAVIGPIISLNSSRVVPIGVANVDLLLVNNILNFVVVGMVPTLLPFLWNPHCYVG